MIAIFLKSTFATQVIYQGGGDLSKDFKQRLKNPKAYEQSQGIVYRMFNIALSFGVTMGVSLFLMIKLGSWIDTRFQIGPYGTFACVMLAVVAAFRSLYREVLRLEQEEKHAENSSRG